MTDRFRWLMVCTGNICRSPMAERLAVAGIAQRLGADASRFEVTSAGTFGLEGNEMEPFAAQVLGDLGGDPRAARRHRAPRGFGRRRVTGPTVTPAPEDRYDRRAVLGTRLRSAAG